MRIKTCSENEIYKIIYNTKIYIEKQYKCKDALMKFDLVLLRNTFLPFEQRNSYPSSDQISKKVSEIYSRMEIFFEYENLFDIILQSSIKLLITNDYIVPENEYLRNMQLSHIFNKKPIEFIYLEFYDFVYFVILEFAIFYFVKNSKMTEKAFFIFCKSLKLQNILTDENIKFLYRLFCYVDNWVDKARILHHHGIANLKVSNDFYPLEKVICLPRDIINPEVTVYLKHCIQHLDILLHHELIIFTPYILEMIDLYKNYHDLISNPGLYHQNSIYFTEKKMKSLDNKKILKFLKILFLFANFVAPDCEIKNYTFEAYDNSVLKMENDEIEDAFCFLCKAYLKNFDLFDVKYIYEIFGSKSNLKYIDQKVIDKKIKEVKNSLY